MPAQPPANLSLRAHAPADLPVMQAIRAAAFAPIFKSFRDIAGPAIAEIALRDEEVQQAALLDSMCAPQSGHHVLVATADGEIVGFVSFTVDTAKRTGEIGLNAVRPDQAGNGVGTWMYQEVMTRMKALGAAVATVGTGGDDAHAPARRAYEKAGFGPSIPSVYLYRLL